jgi:CubicO group peptidase (beta-lactamase class C family)
VTVTESTRAALARDLALAQRDGRLPSVVAGVVRGGRLVWHGGAGTLDGRAGGEPASAQVQYRIGSITKTFIAVAVLRLRDAGALDLTDRIETHVPGTGLADATIEQLLAHTGGTQAETNGPWWERTPGGDWTGLLDSGVGQRFRRGRRFHYSNVGYAVLGRLLELHHGRGWFDVIRSDLLEPLGMTRTSLRPRGPAAPGWAVHPFADMLLPEPEHDAGAMAPAGQLWATTVDLARWASFLAGDTAGLLAPETLAEMLEPHHVDDQPGQPWSASHGLGWQLWNADGVRDAGHGGSMPGFLAWLRVRRGSDHGAAPADGAVVMTNTTSSPAVRDLATTLLATLGRCEPAPVEPWSAEGATPAGAPTVPLDLVGTWHWGPAVTMARVVGEHLVFGEPGQGRGTRFVRTGPDSWVGLDGYHTGEPLRAVRRPDGTVAHLDLASFRFTRIPYDPECDVPGGVDPAGWR